jgi:hypothetical protein
MSSAVRAAVRARYFAPRSSFYIRPAPGTIIVPFGPGLVALVPAYVETQPPENSLHPHQPDAKDALFISAEVVLVFAFATVAAKVGPWIVTTSDELRIAIAQARKR